MPQFISYLGFDAWWNSKMSCGKILSIVHYIKALHNILLSLPFTRALTDNSIFQLNDTHQQHYKIPYPIVLWTHEGVINDPFLWIPEELFRIQVKYWVKKLFCWPLGLFLCSQCWCHERMLQVTHWIVNWTNFDRVEPQKKKKIQNLIIDYGFLLLQYLPMPIQF